MAKRALFMGSKGPIFYDDEKDYPNTALDNYAIQEQVGFATEGEMLYLSNKPRFGHGAQFFDRIEGLSDGEDREVPSDRFYGPAGELFIAFANRGYGTALFLHHAIKTATTNTSGIHVVADPWNEWGDQQGQSDINLYTTAATGTQNLRIENLTGKDDLDVDLFVFSHSWFD